MLCRTVSFVVTEVSEPKTSKNGFRYMQIFGVNDEEEPLKLNVWGAIATEKFNSIVKPGAVNKILSFSAKCMQTFSFIPSPASRSRTRNRSSSTHTFRSICRSTTGATQSSCAVTTNQKVFRLSNPTTSFPAKTGAFVSTFSQ